MRVDRQHAFVLHLRPYRETSAIVEMLTKDHGRVAAVVKGVRAAKPRFGRGTVKPLQQLEVAWQGRGELVTLTMAEPIGAPIALQGVSLLSALYINELLTRLLPKNDAQGDIYPAYIDCLQNIMTQQASDQAWTLRCFERDLLRFLGYAMTLNEHARSGQPVVVGQNYSYDPECGPVFWDERSRLPMVSGEALLAFSQSQKPQDGLLRELKKLMRYVLRHHLGGRDLVAWQMHGALSTASA
jgi:DNA repair protein RecO (recombination protein O)